MGVTKERVRQIEARALNKLRIAAQEERIELPE
jgi:RNA polymerase primary sigma factor/RNA polymerase sigma factor